MKEIRPEMSIEDIRNQHVNNAVPGIAPAASSNTTEAVTAV